MPLGIVETWPSSPYIGPGFPSVEQMRRENDAVLRAMRHRPESIRGMCYVLASHYREALDEVQRCFDAGFVGIKLYYQYKVHDPVQWPVIELASELRMPILVHAGYLTDPEDIAGQPLTSHGEDFARISERYPRGHLHPRAHRRRRRLGTHRALHAGDLPARIRGRQRQQPG